MIDQMEVSLQLSSADGGEASSIKYRDLTSVEIEILFLATTVNVDSRQRVLSFWKRSDLMGSLSLADRVWLDIATLTITFLKEKKLWEIGTIREREREREGRERNRLRERERKREREKERRRERKKERMRNPR